MIIGLKWDVTPYQAFTDLVENYAQSLFSTGRFIAYTRAAEMQSWMQSNAPWTDRTGDARASLFATVYDDGGTIIQIRIGHGVDYGVWLEIAHGGRWAIIAPTVDHFAPIIGRDIQRMVNLGLVARE